MLFGESLGSPTRSLTHTHSLTNSRTHPALTHSPFTHSPFTHSLPRLLTHPCFSAILTKPLRSLSLRTVPPGRATSTSGAPPTTMASAWPPSGCDRRCHSTLSLATSTAPATRQGHGQGQGQGQRHPVAAEASKAWVGCFVFFLLFFFFFSFSFFLLFHSPPPPPPFFFCFFFFFWCDQATRQITSHTLGKQGTCIEHRQQADHTTKVTHHNTLCTLWRWRWWWSRLYSAILRSRTDSLDCVLVLDTDNVRQPYQPSDSPDSIMYSRKLGYLSWTLTIY